HRRGPARQLLEMPSATSTWGTSSRWHAICSSCRRSLEAPTRSGGAPMELRNAGMTEERSSTPLEPDTLVPAQYFDRVGSDAAFQPEKRLMLAVLEEAIATFQ